MRWPKLRLGHLLIIGSHIQFILTLIGALGISVGTAIGVGREMTPSTFWEYAFLICVFAATLPVSFPVSAYVMNVSLAWVEKSRKRTIFDDPNEIARKNIDQLIADGRTLHDQVPKGHANYNELAYHGKRGETWHGRVDVDLTRHAGRHAARWFAVDERTDAWRDQSYPSTPDGLRAWLNSYLKSLGDVREAIPVTRQKWLRVSLSVDIEGGRTLRDYLAAPESGQEANHGRVELGFWAEGVASCFRDDAPEYEHLFAPETYNALADADARREYVQNAIAELQRIWKEV